MTVHDGVAAKLGRAKTHFDDLRVHTTAFSEACRHATVEEYDNKAGHYVYRIDRVPEIPIDIQLIFGDAIHNLRSALDHLAYRLAERPDHRTFFPIRKKRNSKPLLVPQPRIAGVIDVLDAMQPYRVDGHLPAGERRNPHTHWLAILNALDNTDKHRQLLVTVGSVAGAIGEPIWMSAGGALHDGDEVARFRIDRGAEGAHKEPTLGFDVSVDEPDLMGGVPPLGLSHVVRNISHHISNEVIPAFAPFL